MNYDVILTWNHTTDRFAAGVRELPGCVAEGDTLDDVMANIRSAVESCLKQRVAAGKPIPPAHHQSAPLGIKYEIDIYWSELDNCFLAEIPELPGLMADGRTYEEAMGMAQEVIAVWLEAATVAGDPIPQPRQRALSA